MPNSYFQFKEFRIEQALSGMKVTTDACLFGAWVANDLKRHKTKYQLLDIGTGTGLLSLMVAQWSPEANIMAIEVNSDAYEEATKNFNQSKWGDRIACKHLSIQDYAPDVFDVIICNPPFFNESQMGDNKNKNHAVHATLLPTVELIETIVRLLSPDGVCYILYPKREMQNFIELAHSNGLSPSNMVEVRNQANESIFRLMGTFTFDQKDCRTSQINIREGNGKYTKQFWELLKSYYLEYNNPEFEA